MFLGHNFLSLNFRIKGVLSPHFTTNYHDVRGILFLEYSLNEIHVTDESNTLFLMTCKISNLVSNYSGTQKHRVGEKQKQNQKKVNPKLLFKHRKYVLFNNINIGFMAESSLIRRFMKKPG